MKRQGFTLIELMIVVVIIGILAAIAIPKFSVSGYRAKEKEADVILKAVWTAQSTLKSQTGSFTTQLSDLETVGFEAPTDLAYYTPPAAAGYALPLCLAATGNWSSRRVTLDGEIEDC